MLRQIERHWFEVWGTEIAQNRFLKGLVAILLVFLILETSSILILGLRKPTVIALTPSQTGLLKVMPAPEELLEAEVVRVARDYISKHYNWDWQKIDANQKEAAKLVASGYEKAFFKANAEQTRIAKDKKLSQRYYISEARPDFKTRTVRVSGERILIVEGLRAANALTLELSYDSGSRTQINPAGIYITAEKLLNEPESK